MSAASTASTASTSASGVISALRSYITKMIDLWSQKQDKSDNIGNMKALVLDKETTTMISLVYSQSEIIAREVFLVERLDMEEKIDATNYHKQSELKTEAVSLHHLKGIVFIRPSPSSILALKKQLKKPRFKEYHIFFSNIVSDAILQELAEADEFEVIKQVQEFYADYYAINPDLYHVNLPFCKSITRTDLLEDSQRRLIRRNVEGVLSALLSLKKRPVIRFQKSSDIARRIAEDVQRAMQKENDLFYFQRTNAPPLLLVLDRRDDPVTPLMIPWTYQAMVHELIGIVNNRVDLSHVQNVHPDSKQVVLSCEQDKFFKGSMYLTFGDLGASIKQLVNDYQHSVRSNQKISSIEDMQRFVDQYPEFRALSGNVSKHVSIMAELSHQVEKRSLMEVSELEQDLICQNDHASALERILKFMDDPHIRDEDKLRLVLLYSLRYEDNKAQIQEFKSMLRDRSTDEKVKKCVRVVDDMLRYAGKSVRSSDLFGEKKHIQKLAKVFSLKGVENVYTQHKPYLASILESLLKDKLKAANYPYVDADQSRGHEDIFVYMVGGVTYEEAFTVALFNKENPNVRIILGGGFIHNSKTFIADIMGDSPDEMAQLPDLDDEKADFS